MRVWKRTFLDGKALDRAFSRPGLEDTCVEIPNWVVAVVVGLFVALGIAGWILDRHERCERTCIFEHGQLRSSWVPWACECQPRPGRDGG